MIRLIYRSFFLCLLLVSSFSINAAEAKVLSEIKAEEHDAFSWQNRKHFEKQHQKFLALAEKEYNWIIDQTIACIDRSKAIFKEDHARRIEIVRQKVLGLSEDKFTCDENFSDDDSNYWYAHCEEYNRAASEGYYLDEETSDKETEQYSAESDEGKGYCQTDEGIPDEEGDFPDWKYKKEPEEKNKQLICNELRRLFELDFVDCTDEEEAIDMSCIMRLLSDFMQEQEGIPSDLVLKILDDLWLGYDWEDVDIMDPLFVAKTYKKTLRDLKKGKCVARIKGDIVASVAKLFTLNEADFTGALSCIRENYNRYIKQKNWLGALIEWSKYSAYRKVFATPAKRSRIRRYETTSPALPLISAFNQESCVTKRVEEARKRALDNYTKVYLHENTTQLVYKDARGRRATLALADKLGELKKIGLSYEPYRPRKKENVFVPQLYFTVGRKSERPRFIEVPLKLDLPKRSLTKNPDDGVFEGNDTAYYSQAKKDYIRGRAIQGAAETELKSKKDRDLVHSERVLMALLRKKSYVKKIVKCLGEQLTKDGYSVYSAVMLAYSTNSICPQCTPTLIVLMNSHEKGGFLNLLTQELVKQGYEVPCTNKKTIDWTKFRLNIFVTAKIDFCNEARDMVEEGQHLYPTVSQVPKASNPHAKLHRPNDELLLSEVPQCADGTIDEKQRFFYEFTGKDMHRAAGKEKLDELYSCPVCSSGRTKWKLGPERTKKS